MYDRTTTGGGDDTPITSKTMSTWNKLIDFAKEKGYAGMSDLDHNPTLRQKVFDEYNKANPNDTISQDLVKPIQQKIQDYKQQALSDIKANPSSFTGKVENFMPTISQPDGIFGQKTSQWKFPLAYIDKAQTKPIGFANEIGRQGVAQILTSK